MTEETVAINAVRNGDLKAFEEIVKKHQKVVASTIISIIGKCPEAEDIGQETFIRFYNSLDKFRGESKIVTYLVKIAVNLSINELRRSKSRDLLFVPVEIEKSPGSFNDISEENQLNELVNSALQKLEPKFRSVIVLRLVDGFSTEETANILKIPVGTVLSRLSRAQQRLKKILSPVIEELK